QFNMLGSFVYKRLPLIHAVAVRLPAGRLANLANLPFVKRVSEDVVMRKTDEFTVGATGADAAFQQYGATGSGVRVAVLDSGYHPHPDLSAANGNSRVVASVSFVDDGRGTDDPCGHGTHVIGIVAGNGAASTGSQFTRTFNGIARSADIVNVRVLGQDG